MCTTNQEKHSFPLSLLQDSCDNDYLVSQDELREKEQAIRSSLYGCGIDIESIETKIGPSFTLFIVKPSPLTRMSVLNSLVNDPPVELAFRNARIEVKVQNKTINIEIPNIPPKTVYLKDSLQSLHNTASDCVLPCAIGESVDGQFIFDLAKAHHVLVSGTTGSGKSVFLHSVILSLLYNKRPDELQLVLIDPKKVEFGAYNMISDYATVVTETTETMAMLDSLIKEMDDRFDLLKTANVQNIEEYNHLSGQKFLPYIVVVIDEFADLVFIQGEAFESKLSHLATFSHRVGIHLVISTQRPSCSVISGRIKADFPTRVAFYVISQKDSICILDEAGANNLTGEGDMIFSQNYKSIRLQGAFVSEQEIARVTEYIESNTVE